MSQLLLLEGKHTTQSAHCAMLGEHVSQKLTRAHPYNPLFWPKTFLGGQFFFWQFVNRLIKPLGKIFQTQKTDA